jgi:hypothetical protein
MPVGLFATKFEKLNAVKDFRPICCFLKDRQKWQILPGFIRKNSPNWSYSAKLSKCDTPSDTYCKKLLVTSEHRVGPLNEDDSISQRT